MKRSGPPKRRTPLKAKTGLKRGGPIKKRRKKESGLAKARSDAFARSGGRCEAQWSVCTGTAEHAHHRLRRSQGGKHEASNLLAVCMRCHEAIHGNPKRAYSLGHLLRSELA